MKSIIYLVRYPYFVCNDNINNAINKFTNLNYNGNIKISGRIISKRELGKKLLFYTIEDSTGKIQIVSNKKDLNENDKEKFKNIHNYIRRGDFIGVNGNIGKTKTGEISIFDPLPQLISPCLENLPNTVEDPILKYKKV